MNWNRPLAVDVGFSARGFQFDSERMIFAKEAHSEPPPQPYLPAARLTVAAISFFGAFGPLLPAKKSWTELMADLILSTTRPRSLPTAPLTMPPNARPHGPMPRSVLSHRPGFRADL